MSDLALQAVNVSVSLGGTSIVEGVGIALRAGELAALVGPNGAGKTTLLRALTGLIPADGRITLDGEPLGSISPRDRARRIAYLPQGNVFHWPLPVADVVALGRQPHADPFSRITDADRAAVKRALSVTETEGFATRPITTLS